MPSPKMQHPSPATSSSADAGIPVTVEPDAGERTAAERADDDGMNVLAAERGSAAHELADGLLDQLGELTTRGGARDVESLRQFKSVVTTLRAIPGVSGAFRAKAASAAGWAALLFSSWRHLKYDRADQLGADRVRAFITRDLLAARQLHAATASITARGPRERIRGAD